jgi:hypothetical protein
MAIDTPSAVVRINRAAQREDDFMSGTPLNISLFLLPREHNSIACSIQRNARICVVFGGVMLFGHSQKSARSVMFSG